MEDIKSHFSEIKPKGKVKFGKPDEGAGASTDWFFSSDTEVPEEYRCKILSKEEFEDFYWLLFHESMHSTDPWWQRWWDGINKEGPHELGILNRTFYERHHGFRIPGPMWGKSSDSWADPASLYDRTRDRGNQVPCGCNK